MINDTMPFIWMVELYKVLSQTPKLYRTAEINGDKGNLFTAQSFYISIVAHHGTYGKNRPVQHNGKQNNRKKGLQNQ